MSLPLLSTRETSIREKPDKPSTLFGYFNSKICNRRDLGVWVTTGSGSGSCWVSPGTPLAGKNCACRRAWLRHHPLFWFHLGTKRPETKQAFTLKKIIVLFFYLLFWHSVSFILYWLKERDHEDSLSHLFLLGFCFITMKIWKGDSFEFIIFLSIWVQWGSRNHHFVFLIFFFKIPKRIMQPMILYPLRYLHEQAYL